MPVGLYDPQRLSALMEGPVLETLAGCRARVKWLYEHRPMVVWSLMYHLDCDLEDLPRRIHRPRRRRGRGGLGGRSGRSGRTIGNE